MKYSKFAKAAIISMAVFSQSSFGALYQVSEIDTQNISQNAFAVDINASGDVVLSVNYNTSFPLAEYNLPIDLSLIDFDGEALSSALTDLESARNGDFNLEDYQIILSLIRTVQNLNTAQPLAFFLSYSSENGVLEYVPGLDVMDADYSGYTKAVDTRVQAMNDNGVTVGVSQGAPYKLEYINDAGTELNYVLRPFNSRGFVDLNGTVVGLVSDSDLAGGFTQAFDVNNSLLVAGTEIFDPTDFINDIIDICLDEEQRGDQPEELCLVNQHDILLENHQRRAVLWQLDTDGNVVEKTTFGLPFTPEEDDTRLFSSEALAINENGVAVGRAVNFFEDNNSFPRSYAAIFNNGEVISITDRSDNVGSQAIDINDNNIAIGFANRFINGTERTKFFTYNVDTNEINYPDDFFTSSSSVARGINNVGQVVGEGEVETTLSANRRRNGFLYDMNDNTFQNLNDLLSCNAPYTIVQANGINDSGQITAVALVSRAEKDIQGNIALQDDGTENVIENLITVVLNPIVGGEIENCDPPPEDVQERSSGSLGFWGMLFICIALLRRFKIA